ncbi:hypothetical protein HDIA_0749 [Hartmannibacter diazotrophicus]|uniref:Uncharacterized protein n=1 Tax=Hartmannibacter diazotrophicus TaxID=1482074 RepID=A0A2C9D219_9HYPH|nr:hypothetical protein [Hartmannibacter diazotrophicus]SON54290.1 hypothetical protein HDIA_0749 [Hartmannibacter diazotrophicus]
MADDDEIPEYDRTIEAVDTLVRPVRTFELKYPINGPDVYAVPSMGVTDGRLTGYANGPNEPKYLVEYTDTLGMTSESWIGEDRIEPIVQ